MYPYQHFISCIILSIVLWPFFGALSLLCFIGGFLIDIDHNLWYMYKYKTWNGLKAYQYYTKLAKERKSDGRSIMVFHSIEFSTIVFVLSFFYNPVALILLGLIMHWILDSIHKLKKNAFDDRVFSLVYELLINPDKK
ncbi:TPA: hypothetical protein HA246_01220 [Candidatus Woesearchaeota archaeon]|nr:hypothetical protein [Candidatus Woesearchaeota archaeon]